MNNSAYLIDVLRGFHNYKALGDAAMAQVPADADFDRMLDGDSNSIAMIVQHIAGNFRSRYRDFLTTDGEKPTRNRDTEFEMPARASRAEILTWWSDGFRVVSDAIGALAPADLERVVRIRGEEFLVVEAINRSATHTAYHVGQIVYVARHLASGQWTSLSIPKGKSQQAMVGDFKSRGLART